MTFEAELLRCAFLLHLQVENGCDAGMTGKPCRDADKCGCELEMQSYLDKARRLATVAMLISESMDALQAPAQRVLDTKAVFDRIEKVAFSIPPANPYTPMIVQLCIVGRAVLTSADGSKP